MKKINEKNKENIKDDSDDNESDSGDYLNFIKIDKNPKIEEVNSDEHIQQLLTFSNTLILENENNIGREMNKFFNLILNENKEGEPLKVNIAISNRFNKEKNINKYIDLILNRKETTNIVLTNELSESISLILTKIYQKIKNSNKFSTFDELTEKINNYNLLEEDVLKKYLIDKNGKKNDEFFDAQKSSDYIINISRYTTVGSNIKNANKVDNTRITTYAKSQNKNNDKKIINNNFKDDDILYEFKESKNDKDLELPTEMLILRRKFQKVKKIKLLINNYYHGKNGSNNNMFSSNSYNSSAENININNSSNDNINNLNEFILKKKDLENNIFVLLNLNWIFPQLIEIEIDFSDENITKEQINLYKSKLKLLANIFKRSLKTTNYPTEIIKEELNFDPLRGSIFPNFLQKQDDESSDNLSNSFSLNINEFDADENLNKEENNIIYSENDNNNVNGNDNNDINFEKNSLVSNFDNFIKKYQYTLEMIIIYGFFISKISKLFFFDFTIPFNLEYEIIRMLRMNKIYLTDFKFLSFLSDMKMIRVTIDFNSLDNKAFQEILSLLFKNNNLHICQLNFFPSEKYFEPELLFKLLQDNNPKYKSITYNKFDKSSIHEIQPHEDLDTFLLKKLSYYFELNINKLFQTICIKSTVSELSLIFNIPSIISKIEYYIIIISKLIMNLFIAIDNSKLNLTSFILQANNLFFDSRKNPFLIEFLDKIYIFSNKELRLSKLTYHMRFINITNIYRIVPYNINELSIGDFDTESFIYFVEYITSAEFSVHSKLNKLKINLSNTVLFIDDIYKYILKIFLEYPKNLKEISINTDLTISLRHLNKLIICNNYNTIEDIFVTFSKKSLNDEEYEKIKSEIFYMNNEPVLNNDNYLKIYFVKRTIKSINIIKRNIMMNLSLKYNRKFMDYNIFKKLEKYICNNYIKNYIIQFK